MDDQNTYFDITDGKYTITDDKVRENLQDDVASTIRKKIKADDDGRVFDKNISLPNTLKFLEAGNGLTCFKGSNGYALKADKVFQSKTSDAIYGDYAGNYVDADYNLGSIKVGTTASSVYVKNTSDTYDLKIGNTTYEIRAVINDNTYITTVGDNMYRWADLSIYGRDKSVASSTYSNMTSAISFGGKYKPTGNSVPVLQSFSMTPDTDHIDGLKYSKNSTIYFCVDEDGKTVNPLGKSAADAQARIGLSSTPVGKTKITGNVQAFCSAFLDTTTTGSHKLYAETLKLKSKEGLNYIDLGSKDDTSVTDNYSIQNAGGLVYSLGEGYIKAWDGDESFAKVYKVDGAMENMSLASKDNIIVWNEDDEVYSIIHNATPATGTTTTTTTGTATTTATTTAAVGWVKATDGTWSYNKAGGTKATGWLQDGAAWYYLNATGVMQTGWINDNGTWYYCNGSGAMLANTTVDGYILSASGAWVK